MCTEDCVKMWKTEGEWEATGIQVTLDFVINNQER